MFFFENCFFLKDKIRGNHGRGFSTRSRKCDPHATVKWSKEAMWFNRGAGGGEPISQEANQWPQGAENRKRGGQRKYMA